MTIIHRQQTATVESQVAASWDRSSTGLDDQVYPGSISQASDISDTESVLALVSPDQDLNPYECLRLSGGLAFWDRGEEDIYSFDDGEPA